MGSPALICAAATGILAAILLPMRYRVSQLHKRTQRRESDNARKWYWEKTTGLHIFLRPATSQEARSIGYTDEQLLDCLRKILDNNGKLSAEIINSSPNAPRIQVYKARFGGLTEAYRRIGYQPRRSRRPGGRDRAPAAIRRTLVATITQELTRLGASVRQDARTKLLVVNESLKLRLGVAKCRAGKRSRDWVLYLHSASKPDFTLIARLAPGNKTVLDYFYLPRNDQGPARITVGQVIRGSLHNHHFTDLAFLKHIDGGNERARTAFR